VCSVYAVQEQLTDHKHIGLLTIFISNAEVMQKLVKKNKKKLSALLFSLYTYTNLNERTFRHNLNNLQYAYNSMHYFC